MSTITVWCLLIDAEQSPIGKAFPLKIEETESIGDLRIEVKNRRSNDLKDVDDAHLDVWKLCKPRLSQELTQDVLKGIKLVERKADDMDEDKTARLLIPECEIGNAGPWERNKTHILVQQPLTFSRLGVKRKHNELGKDDSEELAKRRHNWLATSSPSFNATPKRYEEMQQDENDRILDDRPISDPYIPPISLLYKGFGQFLDIFDGRDNINELKEIKHFDLVLEVDRFAAAMTKVYPNEDARREAGLPLLNRIFAARRQPLPYHDLRASAIGSAKTDGHYNGPHGVASMIVEFKNRATGISSLPDPELVSYFAHSQKVGIDMSDDPKQFNGLRIPCLGLAVIGYEVRFYALLTLAARFRLVSLTPALSCVLAASDGRERKALQRAFVATSILQAHIYADCKSSYGPYLDTKLPYLPAITKLGTVEIRKLVYWGKPQAYRYLYHAEDSSGTPILVKFTPTYSRELHEFCVEKGHAPALLACERLPGGWYGIVMEYLQGIEPISQSPVLKAYRQDWESQLQALMTSFHGRGLVHGDLRDANIVCGLDGKLWLIDFDWGGKEGEAVYPTANLHDELKEHRTSNNLVITMADDERVLKITLQKMDQNLALSSV